MKLAIMQPTFNPWIGYFDLIDYVDEFVFLDTVQLARRSWQVRNKFKVNSKEYMFSIPIKKVKSRNETVLKDAKISYDSSDFTLKLHALLKQNYKKTPYYNELIDEISEIVLYKTDFLSQYNINFIEQISLLLGIETKFIKSSSLEEINASKGTLILDICVKLSCSEYISALGSKDYLDEHLDEFKNKDIDIIYQYYNHPEYKQIGEEFIAYLGILDLLFNEGIENSKQIIRSGRNYK